MVDYLQDVHNAIIRKEQDLNNKAGVLETSHRLLQLQANTQKERLVTTLRRLPAVLEGLFLSVEQRKPISTAIQSSSASLQRFQDSSGTREALARLPKAALKGLEDIASQFGEIGRESAWVSLQAANRKLDAANLTAEAMQTKEACEDWATHLPSKIRETNASLRVTETRRVSNTLKSGMLSAFHAARTAEARDRLRRGKRNLTIAAATCWIPFVGLITVSYTLARAIRHNRKAIKAAAMADMDQQQLDALAKEQNNLDTEEAVTRHMLSVLQGLESIVSKTTSRAAAIHQHQRINVDLFGSIAETSRQLSDQLNILRLELEVSRRNPIQLRFLGVSVGKLLNLVSAPETLAADVSERTQSLIGVGNFAELELDML